MIFRFVDDDKELSLNQLNNFIKIITNYGTKNRLKVEHKEVSDSKHIVIFDGITCIFEVCNLVIEGQKHRAANNRTELSDDDNVVISEMVAKAPEEKLILIIDLCLEDNDPLPNCILDAIREKCDGMVITTGWSNPNDPEIEDAFFVERAVNFGESSLNWNAVEGRGFFLANKLIKTSNEYDNLFNMINSFCNTQNINLRYLATVLLKAYLVLAGTQKGE